ncbi:endonuclease/exonuclease/phosphatase family protein [Anaerobacillus sp. MEB173]|uniref:endonuclease/exonuclease/phosphatase family protein n=1 Tax=Anaerobacillus sp. MEB173 TaxID=3383345 RepID=UPI003F917EE9
MSLKLKLMSFNIHHGKGTDKTVDLKRIAQVIRNSKSDIIGLNEVDRHFSARTEYIDQLAWLAEELELNAVYGPSITLTSSVNKQQKRQYGNALLSRFPITESSNHLFQSSFAENRSLLESKILINNTIINVFVTHFSLNSYIQKRQTRFFLSHIKKMNEPIILLGDLNIKPHSKRWEELHNYLIDCWSVNKTYSGFTYPSKSPKKRIDYIFVSPNLQIDLASTIMDYPTASDHLPLQASIKI